MAWALPPLLLKGVGTDAQVPLHNTIINTFMIYHYKQIFYGFFYNFWGQHCCLTKASIIANDFFVSFHCPQLFYCSPAVPLFRHPWAREKSTCEAPFNTVTTYELEEMVKGQ